MKKTMLLFLAILIIAPTLLFAQKPMAKFSATDTAVCAPGLVYFIDSSMFFPTSWKWYFPGGVPDTSTLQNPPPVSYNSPGYYAVKLVVANTCCGIDSTTKTNYIHVYSPPNVYFTGPTELCEGSQATITAYGGTQYNWSNGATTSSITITGVVNFTYVVVVKNGPCIKDTSFTVKVDTNPCLGISPIISSFEVAIYPNPTNSFLYVAIEKPVTEPTLVSISDIAGRTLMSGKINLPQSQLRVDVAYLSPGIYFIKFQTDEGIVVRKFIKE